MDEREHYLDEREQYTEAMNNLRVSKNLGENIAKIVANEAAVEAESAEPTSGERLSETAVNAKAQKKQKRERKKHYGWRNFGAIVAACFLFLAAGTFGILELQSIPVSRTSKQATVLTKKTAPISRDLNAVVKSVTDYGTLYASLKENSYDYSNRYGGIVYKGLGSFGAKAEATDQMAPMASSSVNGLEMMADSEMQYDSPDDEYSGTNLQVEGVDEADIVKTNGRLICVLSEDRLITVKPDGADTTVLSEIDLRVSESEAVDGGTFHTNGYTNDFYLAGDSAIVIRTVSNYLERPYSNDYGWYRNTRSEQKTEAVYISLADPENPVITETVAIDGYYLNSRINNGVLYLLSNFSVNTYDDTVDESNPATFVPCAYEGEVCVLPSVENIGCMPVVNSTTYLSVGAFSIADGTLLSQESILGGGSTVYMSNDNLYVAYNRYDMEDSDFYLTEEGYYAKDHSETYVTDFVRIALNDGELAVEAATTANGQLLNQFSMDEFDETFRAVLTTYDYSFTSYYREVEPEPAEDETGERGSAPKIKGDVYSYRYTIDYTDEEGVTHTLEEFSSKWDDGGAETNSILVFDLGLNEIGAIRGLAEDERVYSVRFDGTVGYVVTFRQTDPLFAVNFEDPTNPVLMSALEIPGFSNYLHVYKDGLLFGLGQSIAEEGNWTDGMKLSMFDVSDPYSVSEIACLKLEDRYSEALYNHKAILVDAKKELIAFPEDNQYAIYTYNELTQEFLLRGKVSIETNDWWWYGNLRGLYINDCFYVLNQYGMVVLDLENLTPICDLTYGLDHNEIKYYRDYIVVN